MRLFVALDIDRDIRERITTFVESIRGFAQDAHWVRPESLHVTLKFIGEKPEDEVDNIKRVLKTIDAGGFEIKFHGCGFFPAARAPRVFWVGIEADPKLTSLATTVDDILARLDIPKEKHAFNAHVTLARRRGASGSPRRQKDDGKNGIFQRLQEKLAAIPDPEFGTMTARELFLYQSQLSPGGSKYTKLAGFSLH